ncbi:helper of TIM Hot13 [Schizosaccharomyces pombe]|uniref:Uncharacterized protein C29B12.12 n=1 Tax=Schizosaccharomyces pombe (strain 972 / ATCC 24843) TaxID=284812 RepID=YEMC_SCHPO|nr:putative protein TIM chaperone [Schizosaccharomyces pombe]O14033.1 RecName: Full=Uncharacterized protein C29B12.12 [Schizosaccharomyces pombe 972h-]CAB16256.1 helper of TIM (predicted) [Schizosaccharomyces pombe]|eukprot:NP_594989.1 putative protein TIM chaperone [Schizosaccharomyces pombe]
MQTPTARSSTNVYGKLVDNETRCFHYHSKADVVALRCGQCEKFYACFQCHDELNTHPFLPWRKAKFHIPCVICGACKNSLTVEEYRSTVHCKYCNHPFNPKCKNHAGYYFEDA